MTTTPAHSERHDTEVLVVGAGPVGLTAACQLARLGVRVTVVEALEHPTTQSRAVVVHARTLETLASLGVVAQLEDRGRRLRSMDVLDGSDDAPIVQLDFTAIASRHPYMLDIAQPDTEEVLTAKAGELGVGLRRGTALTGLDQDDEGVHVTLRGPDGELTRRVQWVLAADGGHSTTRHRLGTRLEGSFHGQYFAMADVDVDTTVARDALSMFPHPAGVSLLFPLAGDRARLVFMVDDPGDGELTFEQVQALAAERTSGRVTVRNPRWMTYFEVRHGQVPQYRHGRVLLAGDAAHIHSPAGGQGMNTGIQDAANLAWKLALVTRGDAAPELLDSYHEERHPVGEAVVRMTTRLTDANTTAGAVAVLRPLAMWIVGHVPPANAKAATTVSEVAVAHRASRLSVEHGHRPHGSVRAGEHVPDPVGVHRPDGTPVAVEDLFAEHPGLLVIVAGGPEVAADLRAVAGELGRVVHLVDRVHEGADDDVLVDPDGALGHALGIAGGGVALVRPDGYVGLLSRGTGPGTVRRYLTDVLHVRDEALAQQAAR